MGFSGQGVWVMGYHGFMGYSLRTKVVDRKMYGVLEVMGYDRYGLRQVRLYIEPWYKNESYK